MDGFVILISLKKPTEEAIKLLSYDSLGSVVSPMRDIDYVKQSPMCKAWTAKRKTVTYCYHFEKDDKFSQLEDAYSLSLEQGYKG